MSASNGENEHSRKETVEDSMHESNMELEDQNEEEFRSRSPIKRPRYSRQER